MNTPRSTKLLWLAILFVLSMLVLNSLGVMSVNAAPSPSTYCGDLGEYTSWYKTGGEWKPVLWVWNNGHSVPYPQYLIVHYDNQVVQNDQKGVQTYGDPQVDQYNGWVGYFISKTWIAGHWRWEDDSKWRVTGCVEQ